MKLHRNILMSDCILCHDENMHNCVDGNILLITEKIAYIHQILVERRNFVTI